MTQSQIKDWIDSADEIIKRQPGFHCTWGMADYTFTIAKDGGIYEVDKLINPTQDPPVTWSEPRYISNGHQLKLNL